MRSGLKTKKEAQQREKLALENNSQGRRNFKRSESEIKQDKGKQAVQGKPMETCGQCGRQHPGPCRSFTGSCFECGDRGHKVTNCPRVTWNSRGHTQRSGAEIKPVAQQERLSIGTSSGDSKSSQKPQTGSRMLS